MAVATADMSPAPQTALKYLGPEMVTDTATYPVCGCVICELVSVTPACAATAIAALCAVLKLEPL